MVNRGRGMIPWCLAGSAYSSAVVEWVITSELISSSGLRVPSIASIASIPRCAAVLPPLASCLLFCLLPLFFSFCLLPLASPYLPVFHSFRRWPPGTCRTVPYPTHLTSQSFPTTAGLLDSWTPGGARSCPPCLEAKRNAQHPPYLRYLYLYLYLTLPYPPYLTGPTYLYRPRPRPRPRPARVRHPTTRFVLARTRPFPSIRIHSGRMPPLQAQQLSH